MASSQKKPSWLKVRAPSGNRYNKIKNRARSLKLHTVCEEAQCPNIGECWSSGTATFMVMGDICTRGCRFCAVNTRRNGAPLDPQEPHNVALAIKEMELDYVVVTSVDRDDLPDQGSLHFAACIKDIRAQTPKTLIEVLIPDFSGRKHLLHHVVDAKPDVLAHNIETVRRLTSKVRDPRAGYDQSLVLLQQVKERDPSMMTKSSIMVGVGEHKGEVIEAMADLRALDVNFLTLGQYLRPSQKYLKVDEFITPELFKEYQDIGEAMGFAYVASGPLVRSSYKAGEFFIRKHLQKHTQELG